MSTDDNTNTCTFHMGGELPAGGDHLGGTFGQSPSLDSWYPAAAAGRAAAPRTGSRPTRSGPDFDYAAAFATIDLDELKADIKTLLTTSVDWWPADYGNYGPQMIRMAWHSAGTYRIADGRGGAGTAMQRFAPISSWWDNGNTDKSRRLLQPIKHKYGNALSWADLMVLTGNCCPRDHGLPDVRLRRRPTRRVGGRRRAPTGVRRSGNPHAVASLDAMVMRDERWTGRTATPTTTCESPLAASHQALIYVNPEGPYANGDPMGSARDIRITFSRMAMNDEETVALIAGGHAFGKSHGQVAGRRDRAAARDRPDRGDGPGLAQPAWARGNAENTMTNGIEGAWTPNPTQWDNAYLENLFAYDWEQIEEPGRRPAVDADRPCGAEDPRRPRRPVRAPADDDDLRHRAQGRPGLPRDLRAVPRRLRPLHARVLEGLVQAHAPRHGAEAPLPRPGGHHRRRPALAGPAPRGRSSPARRRRRGSPQAGRPRHRPLGLRPRLHGVLRGLDLPRQRQARRRERRPPRPVAAEGLGRQPAHGPRHRRAARPCRRPSTRRPAAAQVVSRRPDRARRHRRRRAGGAGSRIGDDPSRSRRAASTPRRSSPTSRCSSGCGRWPTGSATSCRRASASSLRGSRRRRRSSTRRTCSRSPRRSGPS